MTHREYFPTGSASVVARCVSAEIRARLAAERWTQRDLAARAGFASHNYVSIRRRDEKPFTLDDVEKLAQAFGDDSPATLIEKAQNRHADWVWGQLDLVWEGKEGAIIGIAEAKSGGDETVTVHGLGAVGSWVSASRGTSGGAVAAHDEEGSIAGEQEQPQEP